MTTRTIQELLDLQGKVAIVTGGAGHLGKAISESLAELGANVVITSRSLDTCSALADRLSDTYQRCVAVRCDTGVDSDLDELFATTVDTFGRVDVVVNNAYGGPAPNIDDATSEDFDTSLHNGVTSYFGVAQRACMQMRRQNADGTGTGGSILNNASMYGVVASYPKVYEGLRANSPPNYHAVKGAVIHLTRHLAAYWAEHNIRVNAFSPGPFPQKQAEEKNPGFLDRLAEKVPLQRIGQPHEMKGVVALLASEAGSYITGQNILVDGGWTIW